MKRIHLEAKRFFRSILLLILCMSSMLLLVESNIFEQVSMRSLNKLQTALIESKRIETNSYAELICSDFEAFQTSTYEFYNSSSYKRCLLALDQQYYTQQYLEDIRRVWYDLQIRQFSLNFMESISIYMLNLRKYMTPSSVLDMQADDFDLVQAIVSDSSGIALYNQQMYMWVGQHFSQNASLQEMAAVAVASITEDTLRSYLHQYYPETTGANFQLYYQEGENFHLLCSMDRTSGEIITSSQKLTSEGYEELYLHDAHVLATWTRIGATPVYLAILTPWESVSNELDQYKQEIEHYRFMMLVAVLGIMSCIYLTIQRPVRRLRAALRSIRKGNLGTRLGKTWSSEFQDVYSQFNRMANQLQKQIEIEYSMKLLTAKAELRQLQYQINPHFLYNAYFNLQALLEEEEMEKAAVFAGMLGQYLSYITHSDQNALLSEELAYAKVYGEIQHLRFADRVTLTFEQLPEEAGHLIVPKLIVQPLIENAYEHGIKTKLTGGVIRVGFKLEANTLCICVEDNGEGLTDEMLSKLQNELTMPAENNNEANSIALVNIQQRLRLFYGNGSCLKLSRSSLGGLNATLWLMEVNKHVARVDGR